MSSHDLPLMPEFAVPGPDGQPVTQPEGAQPPHLHCAAGWVVEVRNLVETVPSPAVLGATMFTAQPCLHEAMAEAQGRHAQLMEAGFFDVDADHVEVQLLPEPLGEVTDADGNPVALDDLADHQA